MKFRVTMKDPDTLTDAIDDAVAKWAEGLEGLCAEEREAVTEKRKEKVAKICDPWFKHGEYLTVEIDTDAKSCTVVSKD